VREAADQPEEDPLAGWALRLGPVIRTVPEAALLLGRRLLSEGDGAGAMSVLGPLWGAFPDRSDIALLVMRSAVVAEQVDLLKSAATFLSGAFPDEKDRIGEEARLRLRELPRRAYRVAAREKDPFEAVRLYRIAQGDPELSETVPSRVSACRSRILSDAKRLLRDADEAFGGLIMPALDAFPDDRELLRLAARYHSRERRYVEALCFWERVAAQDPRDEGALEEVNRFRARLSNATEEVRA
jgi:hypothetical protein